MKNVMFLKKILNLPFNMQLIWLPTFILLYLLENWIPTILHYSPTQLSNVLVFGTTLFKIGILMLNCLKRLLFQHFECFLVMHEHILWEMISLIKSYSCDQKSTILINTIISFFPISKNCVLSNVK